MISGMDIIVFINIRILIFNAKRLVPISIRVVLLLIIIGIISLCIAPCEKTVHTLINKINSPAAGL